MTDQLRELATTVVRRAVIGTALFLAVCFIAAGQRLWGSWDAGYWKYAGGLAVLLGIAAVMFRSRSRRGPRPSTRTRSRSRSRYAEHY